MVMYHIKFNLDSIFVILSPILAIWLLGLIGLEDEIRIFGNCMYINGCGEKKKKQIPEILSYNKLKKFGVLQGW